MTTTVGKRRYHLWNKEEETYLFQNYGSATQDELLCHLHLPWTSITRKASKMGLERLCFRRARLERLLEDTPAAFYWMGFLCADGGFTERRIALGVAGKDLPHLHRFLGFVESDNEIGIPQENFYRVKLTNVTVVSALRAKFGIHNDKTHNPCQLDWLVDKRDLFLSFIVGFIDGDGCVFRHSQWDSLRLGVVGHSSWVDNFKLMQSFLYRESGVPELVSPPKVRDRLLKLPQDEHKRHFRTASFYISRKPILRWIKQRADELSLPYMARKLGQISF